MKISKRISALLLAICLLAGMAIPVVSAEATTATETVTYDFDYVAIRDGSGLNITNKTNDLSKAQSIINNQLYGVCLNWKFIQMQETSTFIPLFNGGRLEFRCAVNDWFAIEIDNPGAGKWDITLKNVDTSSSARTMEVYIIEKTENMDIGNTIDKASPVATDTCKKTSSGTLANEIKIENFKFEQGSNYLVVLKAIEAVASGNTSGRAWMFLDELTMTKTSDDAEADLNDAILGSRITLTSDLELTGAVITKADVVVDAGVELDLAGKDLTAKSVSAAPGAAVIDSADGVGLLKTALTADGDNGGYLPLTDSTAGGYRLCKPMLETLGKVPSENGTAAYWFHAHFEKEAAYGYTGVEIGVQMTWDGGSKNANADDTFMSNWATQVKADKDLDIKLTVTGLDSVTDFKLTPVIQANGVTISMDTL